MWHFQQNCPSLGDPVLSKQTTLLPASAMSAAGERGRVRSSPSCSRFGCFRFFFQHSRPHTLTHMHTQRHKPRGNGEAFGEELLPAPAPQPARSSALPAAERLPTPDLRCPTPRDPKIASPARYRYAWAKRLTCPEKSADREKKLLELRAGARSPRLPNPGSERPAEAHPAARRSPHFARGFAR